MSQWSIAATLQEYFSSWTQAEKSGSQVRRGDVLITHAQLQPREVIPGVESRGSIGRLAATWSWAGLLSRPVVVELSDLTLVLQLTSNSLGSSQAKPDPSTKVDDAGSWKILERLKRRVCDKLQLKVSNLHVRLECSMDNRFIDGIERERKTEQGSIAGGFTLSSLQIEPKVVEDCSGVLKQTVTVLDAGIYLDSDCSSQSIPSKAAFIAEGISPACWAIRHSGRRFVDWRGLEVGLELHSPRVMWTRWQLLRGVELLHKVSAVVNASTVVGRKEDEEEFFDCREDSITPASASSKGSSRWFRWFRRSAEEMAEPPQLDAALPEDMSDADRAALLTEEAPPPVAAKLQLSVSISNASLHAFDSGLQVTLGGGAYLTHGGDNGWEATCSFMQVEIDEVVQLLQSSSTEFVRRCGRGLASEHDGDAAQLSLNLQKSRDSLNVEVKSLPFDIFLSARLLGAVLFLAELSPVDAAAGASSDLAAVCFASWQLAPVRLKLAHLGRDDCHAVLSISSTGRACRRDDWEAKFCLSLDLEDAHQRRSMIQDASLQFSSAGSASKGHCDILRLRCDVQELLSTVYSVQSLVNESLTYRAGHLLPLSSSGSLSVSPNKGSGVSCLSDLHFSLHRLEILMLDEVLDAEASLIFDSLSISFESQAVTISASGRGKACLAIGGSERGQVQTQDLWMCLNRLTDGIKVTFQGAADVLETGSTQSAVRCPSLQFTMLLQGAPGASVMRSNVVCPEVVEVNTTRDFLSSCFLLGDYLSGVVEQLFFVNVYTFQKRPLGLQVRDAVVASVSGAAQQIGMIPGSVIRGMEPAAGAALVDELRNREVPLTLLAELPAAKIDAEVVVLPCKIRIVRLTAFQTVEITVADTDVEVQRLDIKETNTTLPELITKSIEFYMTEVMYKLPALVASTSVAGQNLKETTIGSAGSSLAMLRFGGAAPGAVAGTLAKGVAAVATASVVKTRELRQQTGASVSEGYRFGDITRGLIALASERGRHMRGSFNDQEEERGIILGVTDAARGSVAGVVEYANETSALSSTVGSAVVGGAFSVAGPLGVTAGMTAGAAIGRTVSDHIGRGINSASETISSTVAQGKESRGADASNGYRLGDFSRGILAAGRESRGEADQTYKFGDFSRGLFSKLRGSNPGA